MHTRVALSAAVLFASFAAPAIAQSDAPLKGPAVKDSSVPGENRRLVSGGGGKGDRMQREIPHRAFMAAFNVLRGDKADPAVRLTDNQDNTLRTLDQNFQTSTEEYKKANAAEFRDLISKLSPEDRKRVGEFLGNRRPGALVKPDGKKPAAAPPADAPPMDAMQEQDAKAADGARARMRELIEGAPQAADTHSKMFAILTEGQRPAFQAELERVKKEMLERRAPAKIDRQVDKKNPEAPKGDQPKTSEPVNLDDPRIPEAARQRIKALPPEQQREAFRKLKERLRNAEPK